MLIPASFQAAYAQERQLVDEVAKEAGLRLRSLCADRHWLFDERVKDAESVLAKLQLGVPFSIRDVHDFYGAMVVVPTQSQLAEASLAVSAAFAKAIEHTDRNFDPLKFPYDDLHLLVQLQPSPRLTDPINSRRFEVQIRTGLQYAWWWATHDTVYKGGTPDWRVLRMASEIRANLELMDVLLADLPAAAEMHVIKDSTPGPATTAILEWVDYWPNRQRPVDLRRFAETAALYLDAGALTPEVVAAALASADHRDIVGIPGITPAQAILIIVARIQGAGTVAAGLASLERRTFVSDEMLSYCPDLSAIAANEIVELRAPS